MALPPGPPLPKAVQSLLIWTRTIPFLEACRRRYGNTFRVYAAPMGQLVYVAHPDDIKAVFAADPAVFRAGEGNAMLGDLLGSSSLLLLDDDEHLERRRIMLPPFHGESVRRYGETVAEIAAEDLEGWPIGEPFRLHPRMQAVALEVILRAVIGLQDPARLAELRPRLRRLVDLTPDILLMVLWPRLEGHGRWRRHRELQAEVDALLYAEIARRRRDARLEERVDVLSLLVRARNEDGEGMTDTELRDQVVTLLLAGHETTATALAWAFERLLRHPDVLARLRAELETGDDAYLDAVVKETLRARPIIDAVSRRLTRDADVAGYRLPAGTYVMPGISLVQADPELWGDPDEFRPERFLDDAAAPYTWIPFGGGRRRCLGAAFATFEMKTILATVLPRVELRPARPGSEPVRVKHITQVPARGAEVVLSERRAPLPPRSVAGAAASA
jgi:cytochrome P450